MKDTIIFCNFAMVMADSVMTDSVMADSVMVDSVHSSFGEKQFKIQLFVPPKHIVSKLIGVLWTANNSAPFGRETFMRNSDPIKNKRLKKQFICIVWSQGTYQTPVLF